ncbi:MAG: hypothetical protein GTO40_11440, partial [Deltaproteobacteria bacterium]|nr:hypothetical protein [Deltaproteobacteria bacterium]
MTHEHHASLGAIELESTKKGNPTLDDASETKANHSSVTVATNTIRENSKAGVGNRRNSQGPVNMPFEAKDMVVRQGLDSVGEPITARNDDNLELESTSQPEMLAGESGDNDPIVAASQSETEPADFALTDPSESQEEKLRSDAPGESSAENRLVKSPMVFGPPTAAIAEQPLPRRSV